MTIDFTRYKAWLVKEAYAERTIEGQLRDLHTLIEASKTEEYPADLSEYLVPLRVKAYQYTYKLYNEFASATKAPKLAFEYPPDPIVPRALRRKTKQTKEPITSFSNQEWKALARKLWMDDSPQSHVLRVLMVTGLRVGDVLRIPRTTIEKAFEREDGLITLQLKGGKKVYSAVKGPPEKEWRTLLTGLTNADKENPARYVSQRGTTWMASYMQVRRVFQATCKEIKVEGQHNVHRIRRTVLVQVRKAVGLDFAQRVGGHKDSSTTEIYTNEAQVDVIMKGLGAARHLLDETDFVDDAPDTGDEDTDEEDES